MPLPAKILVATSNPGKVRELAAMAAEAPLEMLPGFERIAPAIESGLTFEENARIKAEYYSRFAPGQLVMAEDSGLSVDALQGAPGVHSARYAATLTGTPGHTNSTDQANNRALISQLERLGVGPFAGKYVSVIALARDGMTEKVFTGEAHGQILTQPRGSGGFGYDPLFLVPSLGRTFGELDLAEKARLSHRGQAFRALVQWYNSSSVVSGV